MTAAAETREAETRDAGEDAPADARTSAFARLARNRLALAGLAVVVLIALLALAAPLLPLADPNATAPAQRLRPFFTEGAWLGTDHLGRDLLARLIFGTRVSLAVGLAATAVACLVGSLIGLVAAYCGRWVDTLLMRGVDTLMAFPYLLLALAIVAALGPGLFNALLAIGVVNIPFFARVVRGSTLGLVNKEFVEAARMAGFGHGRVLFGEILPNVLPVIVIAASTTVGWMILETAGLSFLGLGAQPPTADLGSMLADGRDLLLRAPHVALAPGVLILVLVVGINLLGDGLRDLLDPRLASGGLDRPSPRTRTASAEERGSDLPSPPDPAPLLDVRGLRVAFRVGGEVQRAVDGVDFALGRGEALGIVGESGSGKSVTALSLVGLVATPPGVVEGGEVRLDGGDVLSLPLRALQDVRGRQIACVFQDPSSTLHPLIPVGRQVAEVARRHLGLGRRESFRRAVELLEQVGLPEPGRQARALPHELSGGQRQRAAIAMALAGEPDVIVADEPTTALDVTTQARVLDLLNDLRRDRGVALVFITHDLGVVSALCERVLVMYAGRVVEAGPTAAVLADPRHPYTRALLACVPVLGRPERALEAIPGLPPAAGRLPDGCAFAPRCAFVRDPCRRGAIPLEPVGPVRAARCVRHAELPPAEATA